MANGIEDYNRGYRRTDLTDVGQKIKALSGAPDSTIVDSLVGLGLQIAQNAYLDKKSESRTSLVSALTSTASAMKALDHTQSGTELTDASGNIYDPYDRQYDLAKTALENLKDFQDDPALKKQRPEINLAINEFAELLSHKDAMKNQREEYLDNLEDLGNDYMDLVKSDPSMTDPDDWSNATDIIGDLELGYANLLANSGKKIPAAKAIEYQDLLKTNEMIMRAREGDINKDLEGFQVDLTAKGSPYLQSFFTKMGMKQTGVEDGIATYMPELEHFHKQDGEYTLKEYAAPDTKQYKDALKAFDKFELIDIAREADKLVKKEAASGMQDFEIVRDWMEAGTPEQSMYGLYVGHELFADPHEPNPYESQLDKEILDRIPLPRLKDKKASGLYAPQFKEMQTDFIQMQKEMQSAIDARQKLYGKTMDDLDDVTGNKIRTMSSQLNKEIVSYNKDNPEILTVPSFAAGTAIATTHEAKGFHVDVLQGILDADDAEEFMGNNAWNEESLLKDFKDASSIAKWSAMRKLVDKYIDANGQPINQVLARQVWDVEGLGQAEGKERYDVFYATLKSFRELMLADPYGTIFTPETIGD